MTRDQAEAVGKRALAAGPEERVYDITMALSLVRDHVRVVDMQLASLSRYGVDWVMRDKVLDHTEGLLRAIHDATRLS